MKHRPTIARDMVSDRFGRRIAAQLDQSAEVHADIGERLRIAREQAISRRRIVELQTHAALHHVSASGEISLGWGRWTRLSSLLPAILLMIGLVAISAIGDEQRAHELADVDTEILADELPPDAYLDPGFTKFLQLKGRE